LQIGEKIHNLIHTPRRKNSVLSIRLSATILILSFILLPILTLAAEPTSTLPDLLQNDTLAIYIRPIVEDLAVQSSSPDSNNARIGYSTNETDYSLIWITPRSRGNYNLTMSFRTKGSWNYTIGVYTDKPDFYPSGEATPQSGGSYWVRFYTVAMPSPGSFTLSFIFYVRARSTSLFSFDFPTSINGVFFIFVTVLLGYINAFFLSDLHFKSKMGGVSKKHWLLIILLLGASAYVIYRMYIFTTFTPIWSV